MSKESGAAMSKKKSDYHVLEREQLIPSKSLPEVFAFFSRPENLEAITPASLRFKILTPRPIEMKSGLLLDYELRLFGWPVRWRTRIDRYEPPVLFTDEQVRGPYARWYHSHVFSQTREGVLMKDRVEYRIPYGAAGILVNAVYVRGHLERIFNFREQAIEKIFAVKQD